MVGATRLGWRLLVSIKCVMVNANRMLLSVAGVPETEGDRRADCPDRRCHCDRCVVHSRILYARLCLHHSHVFLFASGTPRTASTGQSFRISRYNSFVHYFVCAQTL